MAVILAEFSSWCVFYMYCFRKNKKKPCAFYFLITCKVNKHLFISSIRLTSNDALLCISYSTNNNRNSGLRLKPEFTCIVLNFFNMVNHSKITTR